MKVLVTGASGYIGGTVAAALLAAGHTVVGLARSPERAAEIRERGMEPALGDLNDAPSLAKPAAEADAVIHTANADHRGSAEALLFALRGTGKPFIHTSGSGIVADKAGGEPTTAVYEDDSPVHPVPERVARVALINDILNAAADGVRTVVIAPPMIYGGGLGLHRDSIQIPMMIAAAKAGAAAKYVGRGENVWSNIHVEDLADLYLLALDRAPAGAFYYAENGENAMRNIAASIARMLGFEGSTQSLTVPEAYEVYGEVWTNMSFGSNSRVRAVRARTELGWSPRRLPLLEEIEHGWYAAPAGIS